MSVTQKCTNCGANKIIEKDFAKNLNNPNNIDLWCNDCRKSYVKDEQTLKEYCIENNRGYSEELFKKMIDKTRKKLDKINKIKKIENYDKELLRKSLNLYFSKMNLAGNEGKEIIIEDKNKSKKVNYKTISEDLINKWGKLQDKNDYEILEEKYNRYCISFAVENEAQADYLRKAIAASLRVDKAIAKGDPKEAETWMKVYDTAMKAGKLQPVQMSVSDMLHGVVTFAQFFELVEKQGFIPPMPNIIRDDIDYAIYKFINYNRELMNLPPIQLGEVKDIMTYEYVSGQEILPLNKSSGD